MPRLNRRSKKKSKYKNSLCFDTIETTGKDRKHHNYEKIPKDKKNTFCLIDTSTTAMTGDVIERREIHHFSLHEEGECTNSTSEGNIPGEGNISVEEDTSESECNTEQCGDSMIQKNEHSPENDETVLFNSYEFLPPVIKQEVDDEKIDTLRCPSNDQNAEGTGNVQYNLEISALLKQEDDERFPNIEGDGTKKDTMNDDNSYPDLSRIKNESSGIHSRMHKGFYILIPKMERELADLALKADILYSESGGILYQCAGCKHRFAQETDLTNHILKEHNLKFKCDEIFSTQASLVPRQQKHDGIDDDQLLNIYMRKNIS